MTTLSKEPATLDARLDRVEKQNRRLKSYVTALTVCFISVALLGAKAKLSNGEFDQITAKGLTIVDATRQERVRIGSGPEGTGISILNQNKQKVVGIGLPADETGSGIMFADEEGRPRIGIGMDEGLPGMAFVDENGKKSIVMGGDDRGYGLSILDQDEMERASIGYKEGNTGVGLYDEEGRYVRGIVRQEDGLHYFSYLDKEGNEVVVQ